MPNSLFSSQTRQRSIDVTSVENALVDLLLRADDAGLRSIGLKKGVMQLVDSDEQRRVLGALGSNAPEVELGGSAANALRGLATLGARVCYSSVVGPDPYGEAFARRLEELRIVNRLQKSSTATGTCLVAVTPDGERTMNTHLGACRDYRREFVPVEEIRNSRIFFTTGYCWDTANQIEAVEFAISEAVAAGTRVALDVADPFAVHRSRSAFDVLMAKGHVHVLFANAEEARMLVDCQGAAAATRLCERVEIAVVKDGAGGAYVGSRGEVLHIPVYPTTVVDTTGAGDMFAGGFLYGLVRGHSLEVCGKIGSKLASDVIASMGVRLSVDIAAQVRSITG
jgi:sugar/nucleoside kinase (ribokinase family)